MFKNPGPQTKASETNQSKAWSRRDWRLLRLKEGQTWCQDIKWSDSEQAKHQRHRVLKPMGCWLEILSWQIRSTLLCKMDWFTSTQIIQRGKRTTLSSRASSIRGEISTTKWTRWWIRGNMPIEHQWALSSRTQWQAMPESWPNTRMREQGLTRTRSWWRTKHHHG